MSLSLKSIAYALAFAGGFLWGFSHSRPALQNKSALAEVIESTGCGFSDSDILVDDDGYIFLARGQSLESDFVALNARGGFSGAQHVQTTDRRGKYGYLCGLSLSMRDWFSRAVGKFPSDIQGWMLAFVGGQQESLDKLVTRDFRDTGLLHVLVLSGGHLSVVAILIRILLRSIAHGLYAARKVTMRLWVRVWTFVNIVSVMPLFLFCLMVGFSQSVQRAFFAVFVMTIFRAVGLAVSVKVRILLTFLIQVLFFPVNPISMSMLLSWTGSLTLLVFFESTYLKSTGWRVIQLFNIQMMFFLLSLIFFGRAGVLSPFFNLVGQLVFGLLLPFDMLVILFSWDVLSDLVVQINRGVLDLVRYGREIQSGLPTVSIPKSWTYAEPIGRVLVLCLLVLYYCLAGARRRRRSSITRKVPAFVPGPLRHPA